MTAGDGKGGRDMGGRDEGGQDSGSRGADGLAWWNALPPDEAERELRSCCASPAWARTVTAGRPYSSADAVLLAATDALGALPWAQIDLALQAHPRIGQRLSDAGVEPTGDTPGGGARDTAREVAWSRREQAGAATADAATAEALVAANRAYEARFGHVFLIFATGRTAAEMLTAARRRLGNDEASERIVVRHELLKITRLRLQRLMEREPHP